MARYPGISKKILKNGTVNVYGRIRHNGKNFGVKNFTKIYNIKGEKEAFKQLQEIKFLISKGINPFENKTLILNNLWEKKLLSANWRENTRSHYTNYYDIVIRNSIGKKSINRITVQEILKLKNDYKHKSISYQNRIKSMLNPIFEEELIKGNITVNPFANIKNQVAKSAKPISQKSSDNELKIAKKLYKILKKGDFVYVTDYQYRADREAVNEETNAFFMLMLMTAHRFGELLQLKKCDIHNKKIIAPEEITKTDRVYDYPLPKELKKYIKKFENDDLLFPNLNRSRVSVRFKKLVQNSGIKFINNQDITPHDVRRIFTSILVKEKIDVTLIDFALEHKIRGVIDHYLNYNYQDKKEVFKKYWKLIRN